MNTNEILEIINNPNIEHGENIEKIVTGIRFGDVSSDTIFELLKEIYVILDMKLNVL